MLFSQVDFFEMIYDNIIYIKNFQQIFLLFASILIIICVELLYSYNSRLYGAVSYIPGITPPTAPSQTPQIPPLNSITRKKGNKKK